MTEETAEELELVSFEPKSPYSRVTTSVQTIDHDVVVEAGTPYETKDPLVIAALDDLPALKRVGASGPTSEKREPDEHATAASRRKAAREGRRDDDQARGQT